ncbi:Uncharacterized protein APZ42_005473 [Daphnia magna]|uniref:Uncharacterized protein n=1 Tax=Daphnia magna TaxID=35525 RepID=A0A162D511_9CRUS|nr:Uncharacterized protein APZ42_005473 [Daphnia magna]
MLVRKLQRHVNGLEKKLKDIENLIGLQVINLCKSEERMTDAVKALVNVFEELDKHSEHNAQASFLLFIKLQQNTLKSEILSVDIEVFHCHSRNNSKSCS